jgi:proteasome lid subunit RPN8/RPN11
MVGGGRMIRISRELMDRLRLAGARAYPEEGCGVLLGQEDDGSGPDGHGLRTVTRIRPVENARTQERERRYLIAPETFLQVEEEARKGGLEVLGFYHSHPDHPAEPSRTDRELAWPWYSYIIVPVRRGIPGTPRSWRLLDDRSRFRAQEIQVVASGTATEAAPSRVDDSDPMGRRPRNLKERHRA